MKKKASQQELTLGLYVHIPFCKSKCTYCDFYSLPHSEGRMDAYCAALGRHLTEVAPQAASHRVDTVYFGGGTPSYLGSKRLCGLLNLIRKNYRLDKHAEITLEANPDSACDRRALRALRRAGFNRISLGVQATDDELLRTIGRIHTFSQVQEAVAAVRKAGFKNLSLDLIYGLPGQSMEQWEKALSDAVSLKPEHLSCYGLKLEEGTPLWEKRDSLSFPDDDLQADMYLYAVEFLKNCGYEQYEISNYAKKGRECRHNVGYWIRQDYLGFGLGASSLYGKERFANTQDMKKYLENSRTPEKIREKEPPLTREDEMAEFMFLGLRMTRGISKAEFERQFGSEIDAIYGDVLRKYKSMGLLLEENGRIFLSREGIHVSNSVMADFLP